MKLARLTREGIDAFTNYLDNIRTVNDNNSRETILNEKSLIEIIPNTECIDIDSFPVSKFEAAEYLYELVSTAEISSPEKDDGLWSWLSLLYFEKVCKKDKYGIYNPGQIYRWIPDPKNYQTYYRHLLAGPWRIYRTYKDNPEIAMSILAGEISTLGDVYEQLASRQEFVSNRSIMELTTYLYYDSDNNKLKKGAAGKDGGSSRRLASVISQLSRTWDIYGMSYEAIADLLPNEFNQFTS